MRQSGDFRYRAPPGRTWNLRSVRSVLVMLLVLADLTTKGEPVVTVYESDVDVDM